MLSIRYQKTRVEKSVPVVRLVGRISLKKLTGGGNSLIFRLEDCCQFDRISITQLGVRLRVARGASTCTYRYEVATKYPAKQARAESIGEEPSIEYKRLASFDACHG